MTAADYIAAALTLALVAIAVYTDLKYGKIPNVLTVPFAVAGLLLCTVAGALADPQAPVGGALDGLSQSLLGIALGFGIFLVSSIFGRILGGGDIKLLMAIGAIQGPRFLAWTIFYMAIIGGVLAVVVSVYRRDLLGSLKRLGGGLLMRVFAKTRLDISDGHPGARLPYAIPIALGCVVALYVLQLR